MSEHKFLMHDVNDDVGVAIKAIKEGEEVKGVDLETRQLISVKSKRDIPLGHKIALRDKKAGEDLIKYGEIVGVVVQDFEVGEWVHTHNMRTKRWNYGV